MRAAWILKDGHDDGRVVKIWPEFSDPLGETPGYHAERRPFVGVQIPEGVPVEVGWYYRNGEFVPPQT